MKSFVLMLIAILLIAVLSIPALILNTIRVGGSILFAQEDWMVSSWTYHLEQCGNKHAYYFRVFIDLIFGKNHCKESYFDEAARLKFKAEWEEIYDRA